MTNNVSGISAKSVQHGLERANTGRMQSLWLELPGHCNLACSYCYACGGEGLKKEKLLTWEMYEKILIEAKNLGVDSLGIPGAGEPFIPANRDLAMKIIRRAAELGMFATVFSTGEFITEELAKELAKLPVEIMIKGNTLNPKLQDQFVSDPKRGRQITGYGVKRNLAIDILIENGFNDRGECLQRFGRPSRMALVTSIMTSEHGDISNLKEIADILRFCRRNNVIFDCDTVLKQGRGASCELCTSDQELKSKLMELQVIDATEFGKIWEIGPGYVGTACDRYMHHLYVNQYGEIRPCIGAMGVVLGNVRNVSILEAWTSKEMGIIRARKYSGECAECVHFIKRECNSCLGRHTTNLTNESLNRKKCVQTIGCWNLERQQ